METIWRASTEFGSSSSDHPKLVIVVCLCMLHRESWGGLVTQARGHCFACGGGLSGNHDEAYIPSLCPRLRISRQCCSRYDPGHFILAENLQLSPLESVSRSRARSGRARNTGLGFRRRAYLFRTSGSFVQHPRVVDDLSGERQLELSLAHLGIDLFIDFYEKYLNNVLGSGTSLGWSYSGSQCASILDALIRIRSACMYGQRWQCRASYHLLPSGMQFVLQRQRVTDILSDHVRRFANYTWLTGDLIGCVVSSGKSGRLVLPRGSEPPRTVKCTTCAATECLKENSSSGP